MFLEKVVSVTLVHVTAKLFNAMTFLKKNGEFVPNVCKTPLEDKAAFESHACHYTIREMTGKPTKILAVIPARGGSTGIPHKNIRPFAGKPLLVHSIEAAQKAKLDRVIVSTDDEEVAKVARDAGAEVPFLRPAQLATNESSVVDAVIHLLEKLKADEAYEPTHVLLLQPTSPLRTAGDIENAIKLFETSGADSLVSVCRTENILMTKDADGVLTALNKDMLGQPNRQQLPTYYKLDGSMIYLVDAQKLIAERSFMVGKLVGYEIERWRAIDLDEPQDFVLGELIFKDRDAIAERIRNFSKEG